MSASLKAVPEIFFCFWCYKQFFRGQKAATLQEELDFISLEKKKNGTTKMTLALTATYMLLCVNW